VEACGWDLPGKPDEAGSKRQLDLIKFEEVLQRLDPTIADAAKGLRAKRQLGQIHTYHGDISSHPTPMSRLGSLPLPPSGWSHSPETARAKNEQSRNFNVEETLSQPS